MRLTILCVLATALVVLFLGHVVSGEDLETNVVFTNCGNGSTTIHYVRLDPCPRDNKVCLLHRGTQHAMKIGFTAAVPIANLRQNAHGKVFGRWLPFLGMGSNDACTASTPSCPIQAGTRVAYEHSFLVRSNYPKITVESRWTLKETTNEDSEEEDEDTVPLVCVKIIGRIV